MIVENKPGGETSIGAADVARAKPDGYSILLGGSPTHVLTPARMAKPPYDPIKDFAQLAVTGMQPLVPFGRPTFPAKTLGELINMAKASPGKLNYAETSSSVRLAAELFKLRAGNLDIVAVPYRGFAPALQDVLGGRIAAPAGGRRRGFEVSSGGRRSRSCGAQRQARRFAARCADRDRKRRAGP